MLHLNRKAELQLISEDSYGENLIEYTVRHLT